MKAYKKINKRVKKEKENLIQLKLNKKQWTILIAKIKGYYTLSKGGFSSC